MRLESALDMGMSLLMCHIDKDADLFSQRLIFKSGINGTQLLKQLTLRWPGWRGVGVGFDSY